MAFQQFSILSNSEQSSKEQLKIISDSKDADLLKRINEFRHTKSAEVVKALLTRWSHSNDEQLNEALFALFRDLKDQEDLISILKAIENEGNLDKKNQLISILWLSQLDASEYLLDLVNLALNGDFMTVVEVSTVIESFDIEFSEDEVMECMYQIDEKLMDVNDEDFSSMLINMKDVINLLNVS